MYDKNVLVIGTGTIGEPLTGLLSDFADTLKANIFVHKRTPLDDEIAKVTNMLKRGALLVTDEDCVDAFAKQGLHATTTFDKAIELADVVVDCTPAGNINKELHYTPLMLRDEKKRTFIAQGSETGFGIPYAYGINDKALKNPSFIQVVSCNTHNIASLIKTFTLGDLEKLESADFVCIRRANDISQESGFIPSPEVGVHKDALGTHHAVDAARLLGTLSPNSEQLNLFSSALKVNSQYMHTLRFTVTLNGTYYFKDIVNMIRENKFIASTLKTSSNRVFSFGRDHGYYGRIFNQTVISVPTLSVRNVNGKTIVNGFCFTPQDGNSLLSSVAATAIGLGHSHYDVMQEFNNFLFDSI